MLRRFVRVAIPAFVLALLVGGMPAPALAAAWSSTDRWGSWNNGGGSAH